MGVLIIPLPPLVFRALSCLPGWRTSKLGPGQRIKRHLHSFLAVYFTSKVESLQLGERDVLLPDHAMVIVWPQTIHGWRVAASPPRLGLVGHFHAGHAAHAVS
jgi:hypothetical protein